MSSNIKLIALDLDGTLLRSDKSVSVRNKNAITKAREQGIHVVLATGRMHSITAKYARMLEIPADEYIISYNGGMVRQVEAEEAEIEHRLGVEESAYLIGFAREHNYHLNYYYNDTLYTTRHDAWADLYRQRTSCQSEYVGDLGRFAGKRPVKCIILNHKEIILSLQKVMKVHFGSKTQVLITDDEYLEFMSPDATKGKALADLAAKLGIKREETMAFGDGNNDVTMLEWAGTAYAMANGRESLLAQIPNHAESNDADGVAKIIEPLLN
jgi:Cof subfamily protein (haloacid dehalogenase superfamily)